MIISGLVNNMICEAGIIVITVQLVRQIHLWGVKVIYTTDTVIMKLSFELRQLGSTVSIFLILSSYFNLHNMYLLNILREFNRRVILAQVK